MRNPLGLSQRRTWYAALATVLLGYFAHPTHADTVVLTATDQGFVTEAGGAAKFDGLISPATFNISAGYELICGTGGLCASPADFVFGEKKNYFVFDVSAVAGPVIGATLLLPMPVGGFTVDPAPAGPPPPSETYIVAGTGVPKSDLDFLTTPFTPAPGVPGSITEAHIGTAKVVYEFITDSFDGPPALPAFGTKSLSDDDEGTTVEIALTPDAIAYINAAIAGSGELIFGGKLTTVDGTPPPVVQEVFSFTGGIVPDVEIELVTAIPLPAGGWLLLSACAALAIMRRLKVSRPANP